MKLWLNCCLLISSSLFSLSALAADDLWAVYQQARLTDPQLQIAAANRAARHETRPRALAALRPTITLSGQLGYQQQHLAGRAVDDYASNSIALNLTQPVYRRAAWLAFSQVDKELAQADIQYQIAEQLSLIHI